MTYTARVASGVLFAAFLTLLVPSLSHAADVTVRMGSNSFSPANITINAGDTVVWQNSSTVAHTVTADDGSFDSGTMQPGTTYSRTFTVPGTYSYECTIHSGMTGSITVVGSSVTSGGTIVPSSAAADLQAQAQALLNRVRELQAQLNAQLAAQGGTAVPVPSGGGVVLDSSSCPNIGRSLTVGTTGEDVTRLQQFLARDPSIYPEALVTGYYGSLTQAAVRRWQTKYHIVSSGTPESTGFGVVGPRTAAAISILCTTGSYAGVPGPAGGTAAPVGGFIQVTPVSGNAPLTVAVQATVNTVNSCAGANYTLDYGDGTNLALITVPAGNCTQLVQTLNHRYQNGGTYRITLSSAGHQTSATVQVFGSGTGTTPDPDPEPSTSWGIVSVTPGVNNNVRSVSVEIEYPGCASYSLAWGDNAQPATGTAPNNCDASSTKRVSLGHTYQTSGSYTIELRDNGGTRRASSAVSISN